MICWVSQLVSFAVLDRSAFFLCGFVPVRWIFFFGGFVVFLVDLVRFLGSICSLRRLRSIWACEFSLTVLASSRLFLRDLQFTFYWRLEPFMSGVKGLHK